MLCVKRRCFRFQIIIYLIQMGNCNSEEILAPTSSPPPHSLQHPSPNTSVFGEKILKNSKESQIQIIKHSVQAGNARSQEIVSLISSPFGPQPINISPRTQVLSQLILNNFIAGKEIFRMINSVAYTQTQAKDLAKALIQGIIFLEKPEAQEDKQSVRKLFSGQNTQLIREEKLFYYGMLDRLNDKTISQSSKSRIYHTIANIKKVTKNQQKWTNRFQIQCIKDNDYKILSESELQEIVKYQTIADNIRQMGERINFKFQSIKKQSQKMVNLLGECMKKHIQYINELNYDLSEEQVMEMAKISRQGCDYYDNGVFILLTYFVQSSRRLQNQSVPTQNIQKLLKRAIESISNMYPPGKGLSEQHEGLKKTLKQLEDPKNYKKVEFSHQKRSLKSTNKQIEVQNIITEYAKIAESNKQLFQELVKATCLSRCVYLKIGLKYYPSNPNKKALTRIKEKMFFKKEQQSEKSMKGSIESILNQQQIAYRTVIDEILKSTDSVEFKISDMVRGKCVFLEVVDIIQSVNAIKRFVEKDPRYGIKQIESRFTNPIPISDVTLKIVLKNQIVAELQLTVQNNAATYNFAHKIYELQRTKVFSKLKITHNYYEQSAGDFNQLVKKAFQLQVMKSTISSLEIKGISQYFKLNQASKPFQRVLQEVVQENNKQINDLVISVDSTLQDLIIIAFSLALNRWGKSIGRIINQALTNEALSPKLKSVFLYIFFQSFQLPIESQYMQQLGILKKQLQGKIFMEEYMREYFQIFKAFKYVNQNQRLFNRAQQLKSISFLKKYESSPIQLQKSVFVENLVIQQHCFKVITKLRELFNFYFVTRTDRQNKIQNNFSYYYNWIKAQLQMTNNMGTVLFKNQIQVIKAQELLQKNEAKLAEKILLEALDIFNRKEEYSKIIECQILLTECFIKTTNKQLKDYVDYHEKKVVQKAQILGQQLKGALYADTIWRISEYLWQIIKDDAVKRQLLRTFTTIAISELSRSKGKQFIYALIKRWSQYDKEGNGKATIKKNQRIKYVKLSNIGDVGCEHLSKADWKNLTNLNLWYCFIKAVGCEHLSRADWKNLTSLDLGSNNVGAVGCGHLVKANWKSLIFLNLAYNDIRAVGCENLTRGDWKNLTHLYLSNNNIGAVGCEHLSRADWRNLTTLDLGYNNIKDIGCEHLSKANWKDLTNLSLDTNNIKAVGCQYLSKADWKNLTNLSLYNNKIGAVGCYHLSKADWKNLTSLNLFIQMDEEGNNVIGDVGCEYLSKANWKNLTNLNLSNNIIGATGCQHLSKADWKNLTNLNLWFNNIGAIGCEYLSKADWKNLTNLDLNLNDIGAAGCEYLSKADWKNLTYLNLDYNNIGPVGCQHLSKADWKNLTILELDYNNIGAVGCEYLTRADWRNLTHLKISTLIEQGCNDSGAVGCQHLSKADWRNLNTLDLGYNNIGDVGCEHLSKADWRNLTNLNLGYNNIGDAGCGHLSKANWKKLMELRLSSNNIKDQESVKKLFNQKQLKIEFK